MTEIVRYGLTFIVITACFPIAVFLFLLPQAQRGLSLSNFRYSEYIPWTFFLLLGLMSIWQSIDFDSSKSLAQYFVSSEVWPIANVNGFFRVSTDLSFILALLVVVAVSSYKSYIHTSTNIKTKALFLLMIMVLVIAGVQSGSRAFLLILFATIGVLFFTFLKHQRLFAIYIILITIVAFHLIAIVGPDSMVHRLSSFLPYLKPLHHGDFLFLTEFIPVLSIEAFSDRVPIWHSATEILSQNWLLGVSNGGFRLSSENVANNTHTMLLQFIIDAGIVGLVILALLSRRIYQKLTNSGHRLCANYIIVAVVAGLLVDFQMDHSVPWIIATAFLIAQAMTMINEDAAATRRFNPSQRVLHFVLPALLVLSVVVVSFAYSAKRQQFSGLNEVQRLERFLGSRNFKNLILIDNAIDSNSEHNYQWSHLINEVSLPDKACLYSFLDNYYVLTSEELMGMSVSNKSAGNKDRITVVRSTNWSCEKYNYPDYNNIFKEKWISNRSHYINKQTLFTLFGQSDTYSGAFKLDKGRYQFSFLAKAHFAVGEWPKLKISINDSKDNTTLASSELTLTGREKDRYIVDFSVSHSENVYLKISHINFDRDIDKMEYRSIWLYSESFQIIKLTE